MNNDQSYLALLALVEQAVPKLRLDGNHDPANALELCAETIKNLIMEVESLQADLADITDRVWR